MNTQHRKFSFNTPESPQLTPHFPVQCPDADVKNHVFIFFLLQVLEVIGNIDRVKAEIKAVID